MIGHSIGEYVAAHLAGVFSLRGRARPGGRAGPPHAVDACRRHAGRPPSGRRGARAPPRHVSTWRRQRPRRCASSPGPTRRDRARWRGPRGRGAAAARLHTSHAFHSAMMDPVLEPFRREARGARRSPPPRIALRLEPDRHLDHGRSRPPIPATGPTTCGRPCASPTGIADPRGRSRSRSCSRWARATRSRLRAPDAARGRLDLGGRVAAPPEGEGRRTCRSSSVRWGGSGWRARGSTRPRSSPARQRRRVSLPTYPFERERFWIDPDRERAAAAAGVGQEGPARVVLPPHAGSPPCRAEALGLRRLGRAASAGSFFQGEGR